MTDDLSPVIESIGALSDRAENDRWLVADRIAEAFAEFTPYEHGLSIGLAQRLKKSRDSIYDYRDASNLRDRLGLLPVLSVSHFVTLSHLITRFGISDEEVKTWVDHAVENSLAVRELSMEITADRTEDLLQSFHKRLKRLQKSMYIAWQDAESLELPEAPSLKRMSDELEGMIDGR